MYWTIVKQGTINFWLSEVIVKYKLRTKGSGIDKKNNGSYSTNRELKHANNPHNIEQEEAELAI